MFQSFCKQDDIFKHTKEVPATIPIYEGYLYWYSDKQKWKWRLFRFDGLSFICLSSRKVKLPCDTPIQPLGSHEDEPTLDDPELALSPTSPLLATPKKYPHTPYADDNVVMASHYQLPSWSVNLLQVSSISLLTAPHSDKPVPLQQKQQSNNCFCLRTLDNKCFLLKARKHKDLERWLFILTKAWDWTRVQQQRQEEYQYYQQKLCPSLPPQLPPLNISSFGAKSRKSNEPPTPPPHFSPPPPLHQRYHGEYDTNYTNIILSPEKEKWIDEWRDSIKLTATTSPEVINDPSSTPQPDPEHIPYTVDQQQQQQPIFICVKKKRSDEVKNWVSSNYQTQDHQDYDVHYFQDANTTTDQANDTSSSTQQNSQHSKDKPPPPTPPSLHYHRSTRGKNIQIVNHDPKIAGITTAATSPICQQPALSFNNHSPLHTLSKAESTQDIYNLQSTYQHHRRLSVPLNNNNTCDRANDRPVSMTTLQYYPQRMERSLAIVAPSIPPQPTSSSLMAEPFSLIKEPSELTPWSQGSFS